MKDYTRINYLVIDADGTMTDAGIYYDEQGNELKKFCTKDAAGFFCCTSGRNPHHRSDRTKMPDCYTPNERNACRIHISGCKR